MAGLVTSGNDGVSVSMSIVGVVGVGEVVVEVSKVAFSFSFSGKKRHMAGLGWAGGWAQL